MAITITTLLTAAASTTDSTSFTTASQSPAADRLLIATVCSAVASGEPNNSAVTGNGLTWYRLGGYWHSSIRKMNVMLALTGASTPSAGALTLDFSGQTQTNCLWHVASVNGAYMGGHPRESIKEWSPANTSGSVTSHSTTLTSSYETSDANYASLNLGSNVAITSERTGIGQAQVNTPGSRLAAQYYVGDDDSLNFTFNSSSGTVLQMRIIAAENAPTPTNRRLLVGASEAAHRASRW